MNNIHIFSGGTFSPVRNHLALSAIAFGTTGRRLKQLLPTATLHLTKMADYKSSLLTNKDIENKVDQLLKDPHTKCIIMNAALCDYDGTIDDVESGSHAERLESRSGGFEMKMTPSSKVISKIKSERPDILVVGFKTVTNENDIKVIRHKADRMKVDYVFVNDTVTRDNYLISSISEIRGNAEGRDLLLTILSDCIKNKLDLSFCDVLSSNETENYIDYLVRVAYDEYIPKKEAFKKATKILNDNGINSENIIDTGWNKDLQGVYEVAIRKNKDITADYGKDF